MITVGVMAKYSFKSQHRSELRAISNGEDVLCLNGLGDIELEGVHCDYVVFRCLLSEFKAEEGHALLGQQD